MVLLDFKLSSNPLKTDNIIIIAAVPMARLEIEKMDKKLINVLFFFEKIYLPAIFNGRYILFFRGCIKVR